MAKPLTNEIVDDTNIGNNSCRDEEEEDRLSSLPDELLLQILSLVPFHTAVTTSTLSSRWIRLWTQLPCITIALRDPSVSSLNNFLECSTTFDHILHQLLLTDFSHHQFQTFCLYYFNSYPDLDVLPLLSAFFTHWLPLICARNPLKLQVYLRFLLSRDHCIPIPPCVFETRSLVELELGGELYCELPELDVVGGHGDDAAINLPNLKKLYLSQLNMCPRILRMLFRSCPKLEHLLLGYAMEEDEAIDISAHRLKYLEISVTGPSQYTRFVIDAPVLEHVVIFPTIVDYIFVKNPSMLKKARFGFRIVNHDHDLNRIRSLLRASSSVKDIYLAQDIALFNLDANVWSMFHNLVHLTLIAHGVDGNVDWGRAPIPSCLLGRLKEITLAVKMNDDYVKLVSYILSNSKILEQLHINRKGHIKDAGYDEPEGEEGPVWKEFEFCSTVFMFPRSSLTCEIEFIGRHVRGSSDRSQCGLLASKWINSVDSKCGIPLSTSYY